MRFLFLIITLSLFLPTSISAQSVDILWQGSGYVPPFYEGLPLWSEQSEITFTAVPQGIANASSLIYTWTRNGTVLGLVSGPGRNSLSFLDTIFSKPISIEVEVLSPNEEVIASNSLNIKPSKPSLLVYERNPLYGFIFNQEASSGYKMNNNNEATFTAFPLFFSAERRDYPGMTYDWGNNGGEEGSSATYRVPEGSSGSSYVTVDLENSNFLKQRMERSFLVTFGDENN